MDVEHYLMPTWTSHSTDTVHRRREAGYSDVPPCLESQGCQFDPTFLSLLSCSSAESCCYFCLTLFCFWPIILTSFSLNLHFRMVDFLFDSWVFLFLFLAIRRCVLYLIVCAAYAAIWHWWQPLGIYIVFSICDGFCPFLLGFFLNLVLKSQIETINGSLPASPNFICHFFTRAIPKGLTFGLC